MRKCDMNELFIEQFADNELSFEESSEIANHLKECESCKKKYDEILYLKKVLKQENDDDMLSEIEKIGFEKLIDNYGGNRFFKKMSDLFNLVGNHFIVSTISASAIASVIIIVFFVVKQTDEFNEIMMNEILAIHSQNMPKEFDSKNNIEKIINTNLNTHAHINKFIKQVGYVKGRFANLGTIPLASLKINSKWGKSTLLLAKNNRLFAKLFKKAKCLKNSHCKIKEKQKNGKKMFFWNNKDDSYIVVNDNENNENNGFDSRMLRLVSDSE